MNKKSKVLNIIGKIYGGIFVIIYLMSAIFTWFINGWSEMISIYFNPFNVANIILVVIVLLPAIILFYLGNYFEEKENSEIKNNK